MAVSRAQPDELRPWWPRIAVAEIAGDHRAGGIQIEAVDASQLVPLRRQVLREGRDDVPLGHRDDDKVTSLHLGAVDEAGTVIGCLSLVLEDGPGPMPGSAGDSAPVRYQVRLTGMAVDPGWQRRRIGGRLLVVAEELAAAGDLAIWAAARDSALEFYRRHGFVVVGDGFIGAMGLPHHHVVWEEATPHLRAGR
ncbi:MAG: GNAT family N-acetyltransferase [Actinomycetota bacterium]|nr:GNAT family N-acetyltransferase [Actinomycetota bacterium]